MPRGISILDSRVYRSSRRRRHSAAFQPFPTSSPSPQSTPSDPTPAREGFQATLGCIFIPTAEGHGICSRVSAKALVLTGSTCCRLQPRLRLCDSVRSAIWPSADSRLQALQHSRPNGLGVHPAAFLPRPCPDLTFARWIRSTEAPCPRRARSRHGQRSRGAMYIRSTEYICYIVRSRHRAR